MDALAVDFRQQIFNDALYCLEQAKQIGTSKPFEHWKYCTWSIVSAAICMESYITSHLEALKQSDPTRFQRCEQQVRQTIRAKGFRFKISLVECIIASQIIDDQDNDWKNIDNTITLRNDIVHFNRIDIFNSITITNADNAIKACRDLVKKYHSAAGTDYLQFAPWIDKQQSENYDKL